MGRQGSRGRSGGRGGGSGYDFQDVYVAWQLAKLLMGSGRDPLVEVFWEKPAIDAGAGELRTSHVDDAIVRSQSGAWCYTQVKEGGSWSVRKLVQEGVAEQLWRQWLATPPADRDLTVLCVASSGSLAPLAQIADAAACATTPAELAGDQPAMMAAGLSELAAALSVPVHDGRLLEFLKALKTELLPSAAEIVNWTAHSLTPFGGVAADLTDRLVRMVASSKHAGHGARSSHTRASLMAQLEKEGFPPEQFVEAGLVASGRHLGKGFWRAFRTDVVRSFRSFRVYGLEVEREVYADLPTLFVAPGLRYLRDSRSGHGAYRREGPQHPRWVEEDLPDDELHFRDAERLGRYRPDDDEVQLREAEHFRRYQRADQERYPELAAVLANTRRWVLVGGQGSGKTTVLRWLAVISALDSAEGRTIRQQFGLPAAPCRPLLVRFRRLAERIRARGLEGIAGRVGLVVEFLASEFEARERGRLTSRTEAITAAEQLLAADDTILLFDALDEVADEATRGRLMEAVDDLMRTYEAPRVVITSRPHGLRLTRLSGNLPWFTPEPFDHERREVFARQWYRSVRLAKGTTASEPEVLRRAADLVHEAERVPGFAESPLLLSILALVHFNRGGLPVERTRLYSDAITAMLGHWDRDPAGRDLGEDAIPPDWARQLGLDEGEIRREVEWLAHEAQVGKEGSELSREAAISLLARGLERHPRSSPAGPARAELLLRLMVERSGLLEERDGGAYAFVHLGFQAYLAACWLVGRGEEGMQEMAVLAADRRHEETLRFALGLLVEAGAPEGGDGGRARRLILAVGEQNAMLGASFLAETGRIEISDAERVELVRAAWSDVELHHHRESAPLALLTWEVLPRIAEVDALALELCALDDWRHRPGPESTYLLLASRPARPASPPFLWYLRRLATRRRDHRLAPLCRLLLIEAGAMPAEEAAADLALLLELSRWPLGAAPGGSVADRAGRLLAGLLGKPESAESARAALHGAMQSSDTSHVVAAGRLLIASGEHLPDDALERFVEAGAESAVWNNDLRSWLAGLAADSRWSESVFPRLVRGLSSPKEQVRTGAVRVLAAARGIELAGEHGEAREGARVAVLVGLLGDASAGEGMAAQLGEDLWAEADDEADAEDLRRRGQPPGDERIWVAAAALVTAGRWEVPGLPRALVRTGFPSSSRRTQAAGHLMRLRGDPRLAPEVRGALRDAIDAKSDALATAAALALLDAGDAEGERRVRRLVTAALRDQNQLGETLVRLHRLLGSNEAAGAIAAAADYFRHDVDSKVAGGVARVLADLGRYEVPKVPAALASGGLREAAHHDEVIGHLRRLLAERRYVAEVREGLAEACESGDHDLAWGAARCLWESAARFERKLPAALVEHGVLGGRRDRQRRAEAWLLELLADPWTAGQAEEELQARLVRAMTLYQTPHFADAWPLARCLAKAGILGSEHLVKALVQGGLSDGEDLQKLLGELHGRGRLTGDFGNAVAEALWEVLVHDPTEEEKGHGNSWIKRRFAALSCLYRAFRDSLLAVVASPDQETRRLRAARVLLDPRAEAASEVRADIEKTLDQAGSLAGLLVRFLQDADPRVAAAAAARLVERGELQHFALARALLWGRGFDDLSQAGFDELLDRMGTLPESEQAMRFALSEALSAEDPAAAWTAAVYLMDRGKRSDPGLARALLMAGFSHRWMAPRAAAKRRLRALLTDPRTRETTIDALGANLFVTPGEGTGWRLNLPAAALLVSAGVSLSEVLTVVAASDSELAAPALALIALSGHLEQATAIGRQLGLALFQESDGVDRSPTAEGGLLPASTNRR